MTGTGRPHMTGVYCCSCGTETPCGYGDIGLGKVFQCPMCKEVRACVYPKGGGRVWIKVSPEDVTFHHLLDLLDIAPDEEATFTHAYQTVRP